MKICSICKKSKELTDFPIREMKGDGYFAHCRKCAKDIHRKWKLRNLVRYNETQRLYIKRRLSTDVNFRIQSNLRGRLNKALRNNYKTGSAIRDLGCSVEDFKIYVASKFQPGMSWKNYGRTGWHIDHIKPLSSFYLIDPSQLKEACHYTNLQPLWAADNLRKGAKEHDKMNHNKIKGEI